MLFRCSTSLRSRLVVGQRLVEKFLELLPCFPSLPDSKVPSRFCVSIDHVKPIPSRYSALRFSCGGGLADQDPKMSPDLA